uniref:Uncharacterized protein n=1 Tax=Glossina austeni TaxID=7395 RepID=A0A1A9UD11_GLOAU
MIHSRATKTEESQTVLVFAVRSLLTAFTLAINYYPLTSFKAKDLGENSQVAKKIELDIKANVSDRDNKDIAAIIRDQITSKSILYDKCKMYNEDNAPSFDEEVNIDAVKIVVDSDGVGAIEQNLS